MQDNSLLSICLAIILITALTNAQDLDTAENGIHRNASDVNIASETQIGENELVAKMQCVMDTVDSIDNDKLHEMWIGFQSAVLKNVNNLMHCLQLHGFQHQRYL